MTPAINLAKQQNLDYQLHEYIHDSNAPSFGLEAAEKLGVDVTQVFKTLVVMTESGTLAVAILPVHKTLNFKKMALGAWLCVGRCFTLRRRARFMRAGRLLLFSCLIFVFCCVAVFAKALSANKVLSCKKVQMAEPKQVERSTGYVLGGVSPLGQKKRLATIIDSSAESQPTIYVSAGRRGLEIELPPLQLASTLKAHFSNIIDD